MIILHNSRNQASVDFVNNLPPGSRQIIDWYVDTVARERYVGPAPNTFPSAVIRLTNGTLGLIPNPASISDVIPENVTESVPLPNGFGFLFAIQEDEMVSEDPALLFSLSQLLSLLQVDLEGLSMTGDPTILQSHWQAALTAFGSTWLDSDVQSMILGYASTYQIPII